VEGNKGDIIYVKFQSCDRSESIKAKSLTKLNKFSVDESVRILNDERILKEIEKEFGIFHKSEGDRQEKVY